MLNSFGLITTYLALACVLLVLLSYSPLHWAWRGTIISAFAGIYMLHYVSILEQAGWPAEDKLPSKFRLIGADIQEPNTTTGTRGAIYLWITRFDDKTQPLVPRSYGLAYDELLHKQVHRALQRLMNGHPQMGERDTPTTSSTGTLLTQRESINPTPQIAFHDLPIYILPEK